MHLFYNLGQSILTEKFDFRGILNRNVGNGSGSDPVQMTDPDPATTPGSGTATPLVTDGVIFLKLNYRRKIRSDKGSRKKSYFF